MTPRERWEHWHWTTRLGVVFVLGAACWTLLTALFVPRREYERDVNVLAREQIRRDSVWTVWLIHDSLAKADIRDQLRTIRLYQRSK